MSIFRTLLYVVFGYIIYKFLSRLFSPAKRQYGYTSETPRQEGDVVIEKRAPQKTKQKSTDSSEYVDFEEMD
ncbi:MAG: hypothetical protein AAF487_08350 [Bacteroidota bacterium]